MAAAREGWDRRPGPLYKGQGGVLLPEFEDDEGDMEAHQVAQGVCQYRTAVSWRWVFSHVETAWGPLPSILY